MRRLGILVAGLAVAVVTAAVMLLAPARVQVLGRGIACGSVTFARQLGPTVVESSTVVAPELTAASGSCARVLGHRSAVAVTLGLSGALGLLGLAMAGGVIPLDQGLDARPAGTSSG